MESLTILLSALETLHPDFIDSIEAIKEWTDKSDKKRQQTKLRTQKYRSRLKEETKFHIGQIWLLFPKGGLDRVKLDCLSDSLINYGLHQLDLGFDQVDFSAAGGMSLGTRSLGLRYENEHTVIRMGRQMCPFSAKNITFLRHINDSIHKSYPKFKASTSDFLRVNLVVGAKTGEHTDTMRGATPNFMLIEDGTTFCLRIRQFPNFRDSVVTYKGALYIPHMHSPNELVMIGEKNGRPHYFIFPPTTIDKVEPYGNLGGYIVVGIVKRNLQVLPWAYSVHRTTATLSLKSLNEAFADAAANPATYPKKLFTYATGGSKWHMMYGWRNSHRWVPGSQHLCKRIHVFYRPIREETSSARQRTSQTDKKPINYSYRD